MQKKLDSTIGLIGESEVSFSLTLAIERKLHVIIALLITTAETRLKKETSLKSNELVATKIPIRNALHVIPNSMYLVKFLQKCTY